MTYYIRVSTGTPEHHQHTLDGQHIPFAENDGGGEYDRNIQIADLNALNAVLAVIKWKKLFGFYHDLEGEHHATYTLDGNTLINEEQHVAQP